MNLRQRYKFKGKRRLPKFLLLYSFLVFFFLFYSTFARYATIVEDVTTIEIANWEIKVNEIKIGESQILSNIITLLPDTTRQTTTDNKLAPGQNGHFDININPEGTDVAVEYIMGFKTDNLPSGLSLTTYEVIEDNIYKNIENNTIKEKINLNDVSQGLSQADAKTVRIYWTWDENSTNIPTEEQKYNVAVTITVKQALE